MAGDVLGRLDNLRKDILSTLEEVHLAREYEEPEAELEATTRLDELLDRLPRPHARKDSNE